MIYDKHSALLAQIEAILNSRPLWPVSSDDAVLTPGNYFLIGQAVTALPDSNYADLKPVRR